MPAKSNFMSILLWTARLLSVVVIAVLLLFMVGEGGFGNPSALSAKEWIGLLFFPFGVIVGMLIAWWRTGLGAAITLGSLLLFYISNWLFSGNLPSGLFFMLFSLPGLLFGLYWLLTRKSIE
ncbi:MAG: hypothetical protein HN413_06145 [Chloroflexi bacterium]|nr:hypothetical protein [Chloroflexota bacterium]